MRAERRELQRGGVPDAVVHEMLNHERTQLKMVGHCADSARRGRSHSRARTRVRLRCLCAWGHARPSARVPSSTRTRSRVLCASGARLPVCLARGARLLLARAIVTCIQRHEGQLRLQVQLAGVRSSCPGGGSGAIGSHQPKLRSAVAYRW
eukprot:310685-Pleurochrysis_carterae.AAC.6